MKKLALAVVIVMLVSGCAGFAFPPPLSDLPPEVKAPGN